MLQVPMAYSHTFPENSAVVLQLTPLLLSVQHKSLGNTVQHVVGPKNPLSI